MIIYEVSITDGIEGLLIFIFFILVCGPLYNYLRKNDEEEHFIRRASFFFLCVGVFFFFSSIFGITTRQIKYENGEFNTEHVEGIIESVSNRYNDEIILFTSGEIFAHKADQGGRCMQGRLLNKEAFRVGAQVRIIYDKNDIDYAGITNDMDYDGVKNCVLRVEIEQNVLN